MLRPSTYTRPFLGSTRRTLPRLPRSLPPITMTSSCVLIRAGMVLQNLRGERDDLHEIALAQLARDGAEDARPARIVLGVDQHGRVLVEPDVRAIFTAVGLLRAHHDGGHDLTLLDRALRTRLLDRGDDHIAHAGVAPARAAANADHQDLACTGVVGDAEAGFVLNHFARSTTCTSRQRLVLESGRASRTITVSPVCASLLSSWACSVFALRTILS